MKTNNLSLFKTLFLVKGLLGIFGFLFGLIYAGFGMFMGSTVGAFQNAFQDPSLAAGPNFNPGYIFLVIGGFIALLFAVISTLNFLASSYIGKQKNHSFIFVVSILNCLTGILGILLGIFAIIELQKAEVKALFEEAEENTSILDIQTTVERN